MDTLNSGEKQQCSKCGQDMKPVGAGQAKWCPACRNRYNAEYEQTKLDMAEGRGFGRGSEAMRMKIAERFESMGRNGKVSGFEAAGIVMAEPSIRQD